MDELQAKQLLLERLNERYVKGWKAGSEHLRNQIIRNLLSDSLLISNVDTMVIERMVAIVETAK